MNQCTCAAHRPKVLRSPLCFAILKPKQGSRYTVSCTFCWPDPPQVPPIPSVLYDFVMQIELHTVWCTFCSSSTVLRDHQSFNVFKSKSSSRWHFPKWSPATADTETLLWRPQEPHYRKNAGFRALTRFHQWIHTLPSCYTSSQLLDDDGWFRWSCGWHDSVNANQDHRP